MGANDQGRLATRQRLQDLLPRLAFGSTAEPGHGLIEGCQPCVERGEVLLCQQFGRRHEGDLISGCDCIERRARCHQCFPRAHVTLNQSEHGLCLCHILCQLDGNALLCGCGHKGKRVEECCRSR